jgi:hypothetical protein
MWFFLRGLGGLWGTAVLVSYVLRGIGKWSDVLLALLLAVTIWFSLGFVLLTRSNVGRILAVMWCGIVIAWSSYGFVVVALSRWNELRYGGLYVVTLLIYGGIIWYLLQPGVVGFFKRNDLQHQA